MNDRMRLTWLAAALVLAGAAQAATIEPMGASSVPPAAKLPQGGGATVMHSFAVKYYNNENFACGARLSYSDGAIAWDLAIKQPDMAVKRQRTYNAPGTVSVTLAGFAHSGLPACLGSATTSVTVHPDGPGQAMATANGSLRVGPGVPLAGGTFTSGQPSLVGSGATPPGGAAPGGTPGGAPGGAPQEAMALADGMKRPDRPAGETGSSMPALGARGPIGPAAAPAILAQPGTLTGIAVGGASVRRGEKLAYTVSGVGAACGMSIKAAPLKVDLSYPSLGPDSPAVMNWGEFTFPYQGGTGIPDYFPLGQWRIWAEPDAKRPNPCKGKTPDAHYTIKAASAAQPPAQGQTGAGPALPGAGAITQGGGQVTQIPAKLGGLGVTSPVSITPGKPVALTAAIQADRAAANCLVVLQMERLAGAAWEHVGGGEMTLYNVPAQATTLIVPPLDPGAYRLTLTAKPQQSCTGQVQAKFQAGARLSGLAIASPVAVQPGKPVSLTASVQAEGSAANCLVAQRMEQWTAGAWEHVGGGEMPLYSVPAQGVSLNVPPMDPGKYRLILNPKAGQSCFGQIQAEFQVALGAPGGVSGAALPGAVAKVSPGATPQLMPLGKITALKVLDTTVSTGEKLRVRLEGVKGRSCWTILQARSVEHPDWSMTAGSVKLDSLPAEREFAVMRAGHQAAPAGKYEIRVSPDVAPGVGDACIGETPFIPFSIVAAGGAPAGAAADAAAKLGGGTIAQAPGNAISQLPAELKDIQVPAKWYDKTNNTWDVVLKGSPGKQCGLVLELTHSETGTTRSFAAQLHGSPSTTVTTKWGNDPMPAGHYKVVAKAAAGQGGDTACRIDKSPSAYNAFLDLAPADTAGNVYLTLDSTLVAPATLHVGSNEPVSLRVKLKNDPNSAGKACAATVTVREISSGKTFTRPTTFKPGIQNAFDLAAMMQPHGGFKLGQYGVSAKSTAENAGEVPGCLGNVGNMLHVNKQGSLIGGVAWAAGPVEHNPTYSYNGTHSMYRVMLLPTVTGTERCTYSVKVSGAGVPPNSGGSSGEYVPGEKGTPSMVAVYSAAQQTNATVTIQGTGSKSCKGLVSEPVKFKPNAIGNPL